MSRKRMEYKRDFKATRIVSDRHGIDKKHRLTDCKTIRLILQYQQLTLACSNMSYTG